MISAGGHVIPGVDHVTLAADTPVISGHHVMTTAGARARHHVTTVDCHMTQHQQIQVVVVTDYHAPKNPSSPQLPVCRRC